ncbi:MAG: hypothetical protein ACLUD0_05765 [Eubacterium ramulus]
MDGEMVVITLIQDQHTALITFHNAKVIPNTTITMEEEIQKQERDVEKQYWEMVSLLVAVLNHNNLLEVEHQDDISFYTEQVYRQLQPAVSRSMGLQRKKSRMYPIWHQFMILGKIRVPIEILNKNGKLTKRGNGCGC